MEFDKQGFVDILRKLIGENRHLQNNPPLNVPQEDLASDHVMRTLEPFSVEKGGVLKIRRETFVQGRGNLIIEYPCGDPKASYCSFVGSHLDVVPANPDDWDFDPFQLHVEGDMLKGRGVTDCLGHVALLTQLFSELAIKKPKLKVNVACVMIANEENSSILGIGVDELVKRGMLQHLKTGPIYWVDSADKQPCIGTAGCVAWELKSTGKLFHSGLPHQAINPIEMLMEALAYCQKRFYEDFPPHPDEEKYGFVTCSTMKPTQWTYPGGGVNQIPAEATICGDMRITPFYKVQSAFDALKRYVEDLNKDISQLPSRGPCSKYVLPADGLTGKLEVKMIGAPYSGIACKLDTPGHHALVSATKSVLGEAKPYSLTGSLPLVYELQQEGFDLQIVGYGLMRTYHAKNEHGLLSDFEHGFRILSKVIQYISDNAE
uniref:Peptidase M20 dimerisation domain-containing protein n=2 Tax=Hemiselmis andersenii TaxID=464988 RepID=A0A6U4Z9L5_HEMAN|mmetsp:Transcript_34183/g.80180  ORF Transcript_34183/g.80180 Transcript_34183/m.80180 type:complete len:432 (+) Transcript_34183:103-1398(+)